MFDKTLMLSFIWLNAHHTVKKILVKDKKKKKKRMLALKLKLLIPAHVHCGLPAHVNYDYVVKISRILSGLPRTGIIMSFAHFWSVEKKFSKRVSLTEN